MNHRNQDIAGEVMDFCAHIGKDPLLVQGAGGNASWKEDETLWVKASGTWLADANNREIFVPVALSRLQQEIAQKNFSATPEVVGQTNLRPSIETTLHALMPHKIVVHIHAIEVLAHLVRAQPLKDLKMRIGSSLNWAFVEYFKPGAELAQAVSDQLLAHPHTDVVFLQNHGVVIGGSDIESIRLTLDTLIGQLKDTAPEALGSCSDGIVNFPSPIPGYAACNDKEIHQLATQKHLASRLLHDWALYPDHVVFLGEEAAIFDNVDGLSSISDSPTNPIFIFIKDFGVLESVSATEAQKAQLRCYYDVITRQSPSVKLNPLTHINIGELLNWEAEKYRSSLNTRNEKKA